MSLAPLGFFNPNTGFGAGVSASTGAGTNGITSSNISSSVSNKVLTLSRDQKLNLLSNYGIQSVNAITAELISHLTDARLKENIKKTLIDSMYSEIIKRTKFTQINDYAQDIVQVRAKTYLFSEEELFEFIDKCRNT